MHKYTHPHRKILMLLHTPKLSSMVKQAHLNTPIFQLIPSSPKPRSCSAEGHCGQAKNHRAQLHARNWQSNHTGLLQHPHLHPCPSDEFLKSGQTDAEENPYQDMRGNPRRLLEHAKQNPANPTLATKPCKPQRVLLCRRDPWL